MPIGVAQVNLKLDKWGTRAPDSTMSPKCSNERRAHVVDIKSSSFKT